MDRRNGLAGVEKRVFSCAFSAAAQRKRSGAEREREKEEAVCTTRSPKGTELYNVEGNPKSRWLLSTH